MAAAVVVIRQQRGASSSSSDSTDSIDHLELKNYTLPFQRQMHSFYITPKTQILVAIVILLNFVTAAAQAQLLPGEGSQTARTFLAFEYFYVYAFLIELVVNMYGHFFWAFWKSGWNWFDFIIVLVSLLAIYFPHLPAISVLRLFRAFRVVRLFKRVKEMKKIIEGIMRSLPALSYAFVALGLIIGIWGIMGVGFFGGIYYEDTHGNEVEGYYFGTFFKAILSLAQITTFDSWSSGIARDIIYEKGAVAGVYFLTYVFVAGIIMMNVLVALLLDNYLSPTDSESESEASVEFTPKIVFDKLLDYLARTEIDMGELSDYIITTTFPEFHMKKIASEIQDGVNGKEIQSNRVLDGYISEEEQTINESLLEIEQQIIDLRRKEHQIYDGATIGNFTYKEKIIKEEQNILPYQKWVKWFYDLRSIQIFVALVIFMNFVTSAVYVQLLPEKNSPTDRTFVAFEYFYVYGFLLELVINMYGSFFFLFWKSGWNIFDFGIVWVSLLAVYFPDLPAISVLRLFRAFRVVRLFKRVAEMRKIIEGVMQSLPSLSYAFVALSLITGIWAIMGVDFFGTMVHAEKNDEGYYFGNFFKAFLSLIQITTFDSWSSGISRDIILLEGPGAGFYFAAYVFFSSVIMMNVLVALLLDNYLKPAAEKDDTKLSAEEFMGQITSHVKEMNFDLDQFSSYLREKAFPDFIACYKDVKDCGYVDADGKPYLRAEIEPGQKPYAGAEIEMCKTKAKPAYAVGALADVLNSNDPPSFHSNSMEMDSKNPYSGEGDQRDLRELNPSNSTQRPKKVTQYIFN